VRRTSRVTVDRILPEACWLGWELVLAGIWAERQIDIPAATLPTRLCWLRTAGSMRAT